MKFLAMVRPQVAFRRLVVGAIFCLTVFGLMVPTGSLLAAGTLSAPTVLGPAATTQSQPFISGVTANDTRVAVWIDGVFYGNATVVNGAQGTASFSYQPFLHLKSGIHKVVTRAEDTNSTMVSAKSKDFWLNVEYPRPAPTLVPPPIVNDAANSLQPYIVGLAHNNSFIKVFIDGKLNGQFWVKNDASGVASFTYMPFLRLDSDTDHTVYATASDASGKESPFSNVYGFGVEQVTAAKSSASTASSTETADSETASDQTQDEESAKESDSKDQDSSSKDGEEKKDSEEKAEESSSSSSNESEDKKTDESESVAQSSTDNSNQDESASDEDSADENTNSDEDEEEDSDADKADKDGEDEESDEAAGISGDDEDGNSNLVLWLVVIAIVIIIVVTRLTSRPGDENSGTDNSQKKMFSEGAESSGSGVTNVKSSSDNNSSGSMSDKESKTPPPPPASNF